PPHFTLSIKSCGDRKCLRVERDHRVECWTLFIVSDDSSQVDLHKLARGNLTRRHRRLEFQDRLFHHIKVALGSFGWNRLCVRGRHCETNSENQNEAGAEPMHCSSLCITWRILHAVNRLRSAEVFQRQRGG